jgi:ribonuclease Z
MPFCVTVLGSNSAIPAHGRFPSSQVLQLKNKYYLIDCGEGAQMQMGKFKIKSAKINHIFISHLHGDHFFGLIGLISTYNLLRRTEPLYIYANFALQEIIKLQLKASNTQLQYLLIFNNILPENKIIFEDKDIMVKTFCLSHRIPCVGFLFIEKSGERHLLPNMIEKYNIPINMLKAIKNGSDFKSENGELIKAETLTSPAAAGRSYGYISDSIYFDGLAQAVKGVSLLYQEATFSKVDWERAATTYHCTTNDAANTAKLGNVGQLMIGHYSSKYKNEDLETLLLESKAIFENTILAIEGTTYNIN